MFILGTANSAYALGLVHLKLRNHERHNEYFRKRSPLDFLPLKYVCPVEETAFVVCSLAALFSARVRNDPSECLNKLLWALLCRFMAPFPKHEAAAAACLFRWLPWRSAFIT